MLQGADYNDTHTCTFLLEEKYRCVSRVGDRSPVLASEPGISRYCMVGYGIVWVLTRQESEDEVLSDSEDSSEETTEEDEGEVELNRLASVHDENSAEVLGRSNAPFIVTRGQFCGKLFTHSFSCIRYKVSQNYHIYI